MRGVVCEAGGVRLRRGLEVPEAGPGEAVLRVRLAGICDTDLQISRGYMGFRGILGHEFVGEDGTGRRVTSEINFGCGRCAECAAGRGGHCPSRTVLGILGHEGAMADWVCVPEGSIHPIPDSVDDLRAVFIEPLAAAFRILEQVVLEGGSRVAVVGDGKLGILCAWVLRLAGGEVHLFGKHALKMSMVGEGIATHRASECEGFAKSFAVVVEATGSPTGLPVAMRLVAACGTIVLKTTMASQHELDLAPLVIDEVRVLGSRCGPFGRAIEALERGEVDPTPLIGGIYPLERAAEAFEAAQQPGARKILLRV